MRFDQDQLLQLCQRFIFQTVKRVKSEPARAELLATFQLCCNLARFNRPRLLESGLELAEVAATMPSVKPRFGFASLQAPSVSEQWVLLLSALTGLLKALPEEAVKQRKALLQLLAASLGVPKRAESAQVCLSDSIYQLMTQAAVERYGAAFAAMTVDEGYEEAFFVGDPRASIDYGWVNQAYRAGRAVVFAAEKSALPISTTAATPVESIASPAPRKPCR